MDALRRKGGEERQGGMKCWRQAIRAIKKTGRGAKERHMTLRGRNQGEI